MRWTSFCQAINVAAPMVPAPNVEAEEENYSEQNISAIYSAIPAGILEIEVSYNNDPHCTTLLEQVFIKDQPAQLSSFRQFKDSGQNLYWPQN
jgi:hypothetical protein